MKKSGRKTLRWKRFLAILFAAILVMQAMPVQTALSVAAVAAQAENDANSDDNDVPSSGENNNSNTQMNEDGDGKQGDKQDSKDDEASVDNDKKGEEASKDVDSSGEDSSQKEGGDVSSNDAGNTGANNNTDASDSGKADDQSGQAGQDDERDQGDTQDTETGKTGDATSANSSDQPASEGSGKESSGSTETSGNNSGTKDNNKKTDDNSGNNSKNNSNGDAGTKQNNEPAEGDNNEQNQEEITITYLGYSVDDGQNYTDDIKAYAQNGHTSVKFKFKVNGPADTKLQYQLVDDGKSVDDDKWLDGEEDETFTISSTESYEKAKTLYARAYYKDTNSDDPAIIKEFKDGNGKRISLLFDFEKPTLVLDSNASDAETVTNNSVTYKATVTEANDYTLYVKTVDKGADKPEFNAGTTSGWTEAGTKSDAIEDDNRQIKKTFSEEGEKDVYFVVADEAGNASNIVKAKSYLIDKTEPKVGLTVSPEGKNVISKTFSVTVKCSDPVDQNNNDAVASGIDSYSYSLMHEVDGTMVPVDGFTGEVTENAADEKVFSISGKDLSGAYTFTVTATDKAGNNSEPESVSLELDNERPVAELKTPDQGKTKGKTDKYHYTLEEAKSENCKVVFTKTGKGDLTEASVKLTKILESGETAEHKYEVTFNETKKKCEITLADVIKEASLEDGEWTVSAYAADNIGNFIDDEKDTYKNIGTIIIDNNMPNPDISFVDANAGKDFIEKDITDSEGHIHLTKEASKLVKISSQIEEIGELSKMEVKLSNGDSSIEKEYAVSDSNTGFSEDRLSWEKTLGDIIGDDETFESGTWKIEIISRAVNGKYMEKEVSFDVDEAKPKVSLSYDKETGGMDEETKELHMSDQMKFVLAITNEDGTSGKFSYQGTIRRKAKEGEAESEWTTFVTVNDGSYINGTSFNKSALEVNDFSFINGEEYELKVTAYDEAGNEDDDSLVFVYDNMVKGKIAITYDGADGTSFIDEENKTIFYGSDAKATFSADHTGNYKLLFKKDGADITERDSLKTEYIKTLSGNANANVTYDNFSITGTDYAGNTIDNLVTVEPADTKIVIDQTKPVVKWNVDEKTPGFIGNKKTVTYKIVIDDDGSGTDPNNVYYIITNGNKPEENSPAWRKASCQVDKTTGTVYVTLTKKKGSLYIKTKDRVGNSSGVMLINTLVVEDERPGIVVNVQPGKEDADGTVSKFDDKNKTLTIESTENDDSREKTFDEDSFYNYFDIEITATEKPNNGEEVGYSGLSEVRWALVPEESETTFDAAAALITNDAPNNLAALEDEKYHVGSGKITNKELTGTVTESGTYKLYIWASDFSGNGTGIGDAAVISINIDRTAPEVIVQMNNGVRKDDSYYYRGDNDEILVSARDDRPDNVQSIKVTVKGKDKTKEFSSENSEERTITSQDLNDLFGSTEMEITISVIAIDKEGNTQSAFSAKIERDKETMETKGVQLQDGTASFIRDAIAPVLAVMYVTEAKDVYVYPDGVDGNAPRWAYSSKKVTAEMEYTDGYAVPSGFSYLMTNNSAADSKPVTFSDEKVSAQMNGDSNKEVLYTISAYGTDIAGNPATVKEKFKNGSPLKKADGSLADNHEYTFENSNAAYTPGYSIVIDCNAPVITLTYSWENKKTAYLYNDHVDSTIANKRSGFEVYINGEVNVAASVVVDNATMDIDYSRLFYVNPGESESKWSNSSVNLNSCSADGKYGYAVYGTDKAGNSATVKEVLSGQYTDKTEKHNPENAEIKECGTQFSPYYAIIIDTVSPLATLEYAPADNDNDNKKTVYVYKEDPASRNPKNEEYNAAYYSGSVTTSVTIEEVNHILKTNKNDETAEGYIECYEHCGKDVSKLSAKNEINEFTQSDNVWTALGLTVLNDNNLNAYYTLHGTDRAGNPLTVNEHFQDGTQFSFKSENVKEKNETFNTGGSQYTSLYLIVIDTEVPKIDLAYTADATTHVYDDMYADGTEGATDLYAFVSGSVNVKATIDGAEQAHHIDPTRFYYYETDNGSWDPKGKLPQWSDTYTKEDVNNVSFEKELTAADKEGKCYCYAVYGEDKAGNKSTVTEHFTSAPVSNNVSKDLKITYKNLDKINTPLYSIIIDKTAPELTLQYTPASSRKTTTTFIYHDTDAERAYVSGDVNVDVTLEEKFFDFSRLYANRLVNVEKITRENGKAFDKDHTWKKLAGDDTNALKKMIAGAGASITGATWNMSEPGFHTASADSEYTWHVFGEDRAGNAATVTEVFADSDSAGAVTRRYIAVKQEENQANKNEEKTAKELSSKQANCGEGFTPTYVIVIDKTAPSVISIETMDLSENGNAGGDSTPNYYSDDKTYYYNPVNGMQTVFTYMEHNYDAKLFTDSRSFDKAEGEFSASSKDDKGNDKYTYTVNFIEDGLYENICLLGSDRAGNHVLLDKSRVYTDGYDPSKKEHAVSDQNAAMSNIGSAALDSYGFADTAVTLCHSRILDRVRPVATITHSVPENTTGYVYGDKEEVVNNRASMYANQVMPTTVTVTDEYGKNTARLDGEALTVRRAFHAPDQEGKDFKYNDIETWSKDNKPGMLSTTVKTDVEGHYAFSIFGTDRAGNPVIVNESLAKQDGAGIDTKKSGYDGFLSVQASKETDYSKNAYKSLFVLVYDKTAPVYRFTINNPKNLEETFDNAKGKQIAYYGKSISQINAKYVVEDYHFDETRILSDISHISSGKTDDIENLSPTWKSPKKTTTGTSVKNGLMSAEFYMPIKVNGQNEGMYRFEIAGCDKAGNLLIPGTEQKKVDSSSALSDMAARTVEHGTGSGRYWTQRKAIDVTAPTGFLKVRSGQKTDDNYYIIKFGTDGNTPEKYDPFKKAKRAYVIVESDDQSPTFISYNLRSQDKSKDASYRSSNPLTSPGNTGYRNDNSRGTEVNGEQAFYVENVIIKDRAGNVRANDSKSKYTLAKSNCVYLDVTTPVVSKIQDAESPQVKIVASGSFTRHEADGERYIYKPDGSALDLKVSITDPGGAERSSGLKKVTTQVWVGSTPVTDKVSLGSALNYEYKFSDAAAKKNGHPNLRYNVTESEGHISIPVGSFAESNDIRIEVVAVDNSGNASVASKDGGLLRLGIDTTPPKVEVNYHDAATPQNAKYFAGNRTVDIVVFDRNVDNGKVNIQTNVSVPGSFTAPHGNKTTDGSGELGNDDRWTKTLVYDQDGDYTLQISGSDALGNRIDTSKIKWNGPAPNEFTVDKTKPIIDISLSSEADALNQNGILYYNKDVTAKITITEHNFQASDANVDLPVDNKRDPKPAHVSHNGFSTGSDAHNAYVTYDEDGDYTITVKYTDMAGNVAEEKVQSTFVVDKTKPKLEIERTTFRVDAQGNPLKDLKDQVYSEKNFAPLVHVDDTNYDANPALSKYEVRGEKNGVNPDTASYKIVNETQFGFDIKFDNFKVEKITDDVYSVKAIAYDKAGNFSDLEFRFSVNRFGSTYEYANANGFTKNYTRDFIKRYYNKDTDEPIVIREINPVSLKTQVVELTKNNNKRTLVKDTDYKVTEDRGSKDGSRMYLYTIDPSVFTEEGVYDFIISSEDVAGNRNSTSQEVKQDGEKEKQIIDKFPIGFQVDKTVPTNRITGVKSNQTRFRQNSLTVYIYPEDAQTAVDTVKLKYAYADADSNAARRSADTAFKETLYRYYGEDEKPGTDEEDLKTFVNDSGEIEIPITLGEGSKWQLLEIITTDKAGNESIDFRAENAEQNLPDTRRSFLITTNPIIQYYNNKPLFYGSISGAVLLLLLLLFLKRKKDEEAA